MAIAVNLYMLTICSMFFHTFVKNKAIVRMREKFKLYISQRKLFDKNSKILVAFSGGADSVALAHLLLSEGYNIRLAHVNFMLRAEEAERDMNFCLDFARKNNLKIHLLKTDTNKYAQEHKLSIETAAREIRYNWFETLIQEHKLDLIATAHHADDNVETVLFNLIRGTGLRGLTGIPVRNGNIVRPLLFATKQEILDYCKANNLDFVTDSTNLEANYTRNKIRLKVIPELENVNPLARKNIITTAQNLEQTYLLFEQLVEQVKKDLTLEKENKIIIDLNKLRKYRGSEALMFEILKDYGFGYKTIKQISSNLEAQSGKIYYSGTHRLITSRDKLILAPKKQINYSELIIDRISDIETDQYSLKFEITNNKTNLKQPPEIAMLDKAKICFPLIIRKWQKGDYFIPFGMKGKKKLSDFFTDQKLSLDAKEEVLVMQDCSGKIVWVIPYRTDNRFAVTNSTGEILKITFTKKS